MKDLKVILFNVVLMCIVLYGMFSFYNLSIDFRVWGSLGRFAFMWCGSVYAFLYIMFKTGTDTK